MKIQHIIAVVVLALTAATTVSLAESTEPAFLIDAKGRLVLSEAVVIDDSAYVSASTFNEVFSTDLDTIVVGACNGGTCRTSDGSILSCPSSGGPSCNSGQSCVCTCQTNDDGSAFAVNRCIRKVSIEPTPIDTDPAIIEP